MPRDAPTRNRRPPRKTAGDFIVDRIDAAAREQIGRSKGASALLKCAVYQGYARFSNHDGITWVSDRNLAARLGCTPPEIRAGRAALIDDGLIEPTDKLPATARGPGKGWLLPKIAARATESTGQLTTESTTQLATGLTDRPATSDDSVRTDISQRDREGEGGAFHSQHSATALAGAHAAAELTAEFGFTPRGSNPAAHTWPGGWRAWVGDSRWMFIQSKPAEMTAESVAEAHAVFGVLAERFPDLRMNDDQPFSRSFPLGDADPFEIRYVVDRALSRHRARTGNRP